MEQVHTRIKLISVSPDTFLGGNVGERIVLTDIVKWLYDHTKAQEVAASKNSVPELYVDGMDEEQIWQQIELQNNFTLDTLVESSSKFLAMKYDSLQLKIAGDEDDNAESGEDDDQEGEEQSENEDEWLEEDAEGDEEGNESVNERPNGNADEEEESDDENTDSHQRKRGGMESNLEDDFFKLKELNRFLDEEDQKEMNKSKKRDTDEDDGIDLFQDLDDDDGDEDAVDMKYADFFDKPKKGFKEPSYEDEEDYDRPDEEGGRTVKFNLDQNEEFSDTNEHGEEVQVSDLEDDPQSTHEERQERLKKRIEKLEQKSISDKPWQLKGEVKATSRPENSLLEEYLEFDSATRPAPLITEETTKRLDDIILQRVKDRAFDDVERKTRPSDTSTDFRKRLVLDQTKSKESLSQIYEKDFLDKVEAQKEKDSNVLEEEPAIKREIREKMKQLMAKLDALCNYHFTPKPAAPDIKIITNTPAIEMEEAAPVAVSEATLLAPEEVKRPNKGDVVGRTERDKTDKNRERRRKKLKQKLNATKETEAGKMSKPTLDKVTKARNVQKMKEVGTGKELKSSKAFFSKLQEEVKIKGNKKSSKRRPDTDNSISAKKLKL